MLQVRFIFHGNVLTIQICSCAVFIDFMCIFMSTIILHRLGILLSREYDFRKVKNYYIKSAYCIICDDYGVNIDEIWMNWDCFNTTTYNNFGDRGKTMQRSPSDNRARWITTHFKGFMRKNIGKINRSVRLYVFLVLTSQFQARSTVVGNLASEMDAQQVF